MQKPFYISTAIPYVNAKPHIGHALEYVQTDAIARYQRLLGKDVFFLSGTDENSLKNVQAAEKAGKPVREFVNEHYVHFYNFKSSLNISFDDFIRTVEDRHVIGAQKLWSMFNPDDIYKKKYRGLYCVGCEAFYTEEEFSEIGFKSYGTNVKISRKVSIYGASNISIGNNVRIDDFCILSGKIEIGSHIHISAFCALYGAMGIKMEDYSGLSPRTTIFSAMDDFSGDYLIGPIHDVSKTNVTGGLVKICKYVQIGAGSIIFPNIIQPYMV